MSSELVRRQLSTALDLLIQVERDPSGARRVVAVCEVCPSPSTGVECQEIFSFRRSESGGDFIQTTWRPSFDHKIFVAGLHEQYKELLSVAG
jgi:pilus assembly protein CpaF